MARQENRSRTMLPELATRVGACYVGAIVILAGLMQFAA